MLLYLKIINTDALESGRKSNIFFNQQGGTIGSHSSNTWSIQNNYQDIVNIQARIEWHENGYCIAALAPSVFVNNADIFTLKHLVKLQQGDALRIADLNLQIMLTDNPNIEDPLATPLTTLVSTYDDHMQEILDKKQTNAFVQNSHDDFIKKTHLTERLATDPLELLKQDKDGSTRYSDSQRLDKQLPSFSAFYSQEPEMDNSFLDLPTSNLIGEEDNIKEKHLTLTPLLRGLAAEVPLNNSKEVHDFLEEVGASLRNTIEGLINLNKMETQFKDKHLRPIEDNPLRLTNNYQETINILYGDDKCSVHLAPPSAIAESLRNIQIHDQANRIAISKALEALLHAFSPENLTKRFVHYRRSSDVTKIDNYWIWNMYQNYYQELTSDRQNGFEKLFNEVYQQTYDYEIRLLQLER